MGPTRSATPSLPSTRSSRSRRPTEGMSQGTVMTSPLTEIASGLAFPEGPVMLPDGAMLVVEIAKGCVTRIDRNGRKSIVATPGGGPNGAAFGPGGHLYICNNGGFAWETVEDRLMPARQADDYSGGRIERIDVGT